MHGELYKEKEILLKTVIKQIIERTDRKTIGMTKEPVMKKLPT